MYYRFIPISSQKEVFLERHWIIWKIYTIFQKYGVSQKVKTRLVGSGIRRTWPYFKIKM